MSNRDARLSEEERGSIVDLLQAIGELNDYAYRELNREVPNERRIFTEAMRVIQRLIKGADLIDVRLLDETGSELYFAETHGELWNQGAAEERERRLARRYSVTDTPPASAGACVFQTGKVHVMPDVKADPYYSELFPATKRMIVAPIKVRGLTFGVLDIAGSGEAEFPAHAHSIATMLGQQLGLYCVLIGNIRELRETQMNLGFSIKELRNLQRQQVQTFQDLSHQLKTPILQAHARVQLALDEVTDDKLQRRLWAIRGLCSKARRVLYNTELFAALAREETVKPENSAPLRRDDLVRLLIEAAEDSQYLSWARDIRFVVDTKSLERGIGLRHPPIQALDVDRNLLQQALFDILDNAGKYSYQSTVVQISAGRTASGGFYILITNRGLPISTREVALVRNRGWRGEDAKETTGEGSGLGLWIADQIMKAHEGELVIHPTMRDLTEIRLVFPGSRVS